MAQLANQGFRLDLNLSESKNDDALWNNLYNPGIADDLKILVNNLKNISTLGPGNEGKALTFSFTTNDINDANYGVEGLTQFRAPRFFTTTKVPATEGLSDTTYSNDDIVQIDRTVVFKVGTQDGSGAVGEGVAGPDSSGAFSTDPSNPAPFTSTITLVNGTNYYVCNSNARNSFKLSTRPSTDSAGISTIPIFDVDSSTTGDNGTTYNFIRTDAVYSPNLTSFIRPEVMDDNFGYLGSGNINDTFDANLNAYEYSEFLISKKYKTNERIKTDRDIKYEGSVRVKDPANHNTTQVILNRITTVDGDPSFPDSPGVFIGNTRAFSTDNNPWEKDISLFSTKTHADEVKIGDLEFGGVVDDSSGSITDGKIKIDGLNIDGTEIVDVSSEELSDSKFSALLDGGNVYKFPMIINGETYFILVERE